MLAPYADGDDLSRRGAVLITGGATGIGFACAKSLCRRGFGVALMGRRPDRVHAAVEKLRVSFPAVTVTGHPADVSDRDQVEATVSSVIAAEKRLHALVDCAAVGITRPILESCGDDWTTTFAAGTFGSVLCCAAVARHMCAVGSGRLVLIGSIVNAFADVGMAAHCADKAAVSSLTRSLAVELAPLGVVANAIAPGWVRTEAAEEYMPPGDDWIKGVNPLGRLGRTDEIANVVEYLVADAPAFLTGVTIPVDGGATARGPF